ncbi:transcription factor SPT20 homolog [Arvicola amphibius]|uniref:transcription factor SPT20 homolog n=1 Tax=Arvicola amphibius TaxID=1047088 RepID=UPI001C097CF5|nr:transcription factor SPT20 homolog [Arvicola amphibius]
MTDWSLEEAWKRTDDIIDSVQQQPPPLRSTSCGEKSLQEKLYDIYVEECKKEPEAEGLRSNVNLLRKLMKREPLPCLVVSLYPENQGYSLMLKDKDGVLIEPYPGPYVGQKLLEYLDAEELPSFLIDILEKSPVNVFHSGCVIAEIRDYRQCSDIYPPEEPAAEAAVSSPACQVRHILLRPTMQSLVSDVESITSNSSQWTQEEKLELESQLILATAEPLCLDPSVAVTCTTNKLLFNKQKIMTDSMKKSFTGREWPCLDLEEQKHACTSPPDVETMIACRKRAEIKPGDPYNLKIPEAGKCVDTWKQKPCQLVAPSEVDVQKYAKGKQSVPHGDSASTAGPAPEVKCGYLFDYEKGCHPWETEPSVMQSLSDPFFSSEIGSPTEGGCDSQVFLPQVTLSDCLLGSVAGEKIESGKATDVCQESAQSQAECLSKELQGSTDSICLGQPSQGMKASSPSVTSPVLETRVKSPAPVFTLPSTSGKGSSAPSPPSIAVRGRKLPRLSPSLQSASLPQQTLWGMSSINALAAAVQTSASSSESHPVTQSPSSGTAQNVINLFSQAQGDPGLKKGSPQVQSFPTSAPAFTETSSKDVLSLKGQTSAPQNSVQLILKNTAGSIAVNLPSGTVIFRQESQTEQPQPWLQLQQPHQQPQSRLQHQPPRAPIPPQPAPQTYQGSQGASVQQWAVPTQQTGLFNLAEARRVCQPQTTVCQVGSSQSPGQILPSQSFQNPTAQVQQLQAWGQNVQLRFLPHIVSVPRAATQHSHQGRTGGQHSDTESGGPPTTPKS